MFANMDTVPEPGWLEPLAAALRENSNVAAVNPLLLLMDGVSVNAAGQTIHVTGLGFNRGLGEPAGKFGDRMFAVDGIHGAFFAMKRSTYDLVGGFDATGFLYHEDVNCSWLLRLAGYELCCVPASRVRHDYYLSMHAEKFHLLERNRVAMLMAYLRLGTLLALLPMLLFTELLAWGYAILRRDGFGGAKWRSYGWVVAHREQIRERRRLAAKLRRAGDFRLLAGFRLGVRLAAVCSPRARARTRQAQARRRDRQSVGFRRAAVHSSPHSPCALLRNAGKRAAISASVRSALSYTRVMRGPRRSGSFCTRSIV